MGAFETVVLALAIPLITWLLIGVCVYWIARVIHGPPDQEVREQYPHVDELAILAWPYTLYVLLTYRESTPVLTTPLLSPLRNITEEDMPWVLELERSCFPEGDAWSAEEFLRDDHCAWAIELLGVGVPIGYVVFETHDVDVERVHITNLAIRPAYRGRGIATDIIKRFFAWDVVTLEVRESNTEARKLYEKLGFKVVGRQEAMYVNPVEDGILMEHRNEA